MVSQNETEALRYHLLSISMYKLVCVANQIVVILKGKNWRFLELSRKKGEEGKQNTIDCGSSQCFCEIPHRFVWRRSRWRLCYWQWRFQDRVKAVGRKGEKGRSFAILCCASTPFLVTAPLLKSRNFHFTAFVLVSLLLKFKWFSSIRLELLGLFLHVQPWLWRWLFIWIVFCLSLWASLQIIFH